jgi:hypothetical protein
MSVPTILKGHEFFSHLRVEEVDRISRFARGLFLSGAPPQQQM